MGLFPIRSAVLRRHYARQDKCPECGGYLDTGWECNDCGYDAQPEAKPHFEGGPTGQAREGD